ncbi:MAG: polysaccharide biosynthesis tyrosine autokinase, partial [Acidobacteriota bacterium]|nr:polysaccharide biosynthesis tyrosine autokinase [Acidobacteriota bacterium]
DKERALRAEFDRQRAETVTQNEAAINYRIIQQEIETNKQLLDGLLQRAKENDVMLAGTLNNVRVVDYAIAPDDPVGPRRLLATLLAFVVSLAVGVGLAFLLEFLDDTLRTSDDIEKVLMLPAIGVIPSAGRSGRKLAAAPKTDLALANVMNAEPALLLNSDGRSALAEAFRHLRTSVLLSTAGRPPRSLVVTSSQPSEGKTTTSVNVAITLAQRGVPVVLIDGDMRRPRMHAIFNRSNAAGLSTFLSSDMGEADLLNMVVETDVENLFLLPSGPTPPNPAELIGSERMKALLASFGAIFAHIVIDSPPVGSFTDGALFASMTDGALLVVHSGRSSRAVVHRAKQQLQTLGIRIFGVVLNNVNLKHEESYYSSYYAGSYYNASAGVESVSSGS